MLIQLSYLHHSFYKIILLLGQSDNQIWKPLSFNDTCLSFLYDTFYTLLPLYNLASFCIGITVIQNKSGYRVLRKSVTFQTCLFNKCLHICTACNVCKTKHQLVLPFFWSYWKNSHLKREKLEGPVYGWHLGGSS